MWFRRMAGLCPLAFLSLAIPSLALAEETPVKIGVLTDLSGFAADSGGAGVVTAVKMAVKDAGGEVLGKKIEIVQADTLNKPDSALRRRGAGSRSRVSTRSSACR
jgi:branched-chain amino acid transport system substrate-binding protein